MYVTDNHFVSDFLHLHEELSCFKIPVKLSLQDGKFIFHELSSGIDGVIELLSHFLTVSTPDNLVIPGTDRDNRIGMKVFLYQSILPVSVDESLQNRILYP